MGPRRGFSHGVAGIAWALTEAGYLLGDDRLANSATEAFAYERELYEPEIGDWRDVRHPMEIRAAPVTWCNGAPGIGLARLLHANRGEMDARLRAEIADALGRTMKAGFGNGYALCHGDAGNLDVLLIGSEVLNSASLRDSALARAGTLAAAAEKGRPLCGLPGAVEIPGLFAGLAGIGYGLLRAADPEGIPSVLAFETPDRIAALAL